MRTNAELAHRVFQFLIAQQVEEVIVCAGARNVPLIENVKEYAFKVKSYFEERAAGFFALGRIRASQKPVAVITTSGTAVAELLPSVIEAYYQGLPLIVISADRPKHYRHSGSPQSIEQVGIFGSYVHHCFDFDGNQNIFNFSFHESKPLHINICFKEPLIDQFKIEKDFFNVQSIQNFSELEHEVYKKKSYSLTQLVTSTHTYKQPLFIISSLSEKYRDQVVEFLSRHQILHYAEILSGLQNHKKLQHLQLQVCEPFIKDFFNKKYFSSAVRIGGIPTLRFWRDLEGAFSDVPVLNISELHFSGLARTTENFHLSQLSDLNTYANPHFNEMIQIRNKIKDEFKKIILKHKASEHFVLYALSRLLENEPLYVGNSLPIREWDLINESSYSQTYGHRGANGIDGQVSGFLGWGNHFDVAWSVLGDLTALYDLSALGLNADQTYSSMKRIVVVNNQGGQIFNKLFKNEMLLNRQNAQFEYWAKLWNWQYLRVETEADLFKVQELVQNKTHAHYVIELVVDPNASQQVWSEWAQVKFE